MMSGAVSAGTSNNILFRCAATLFFVWPVAHVMALQNVPLGTFLFWRAYEFFRKAIFSKSELFGQAVQISLAMLWVWLLLVCLRVDANPYRSLQERKQRGFPVFAAFGVRGLIVEELEITTVLYRDGFADPLSESDLPQIVVALHPEYFLQHSGLIQEHSVYDAELNIIFTLEGLPRYAMEITQFFIHEPLMQKVQNDLGRMVHQIVMKGFDFVVAILRLVAVSPLFAYLVIRVYQTGPGVIFGNVRIGRDGRVSRCFKFRSMVPNAADVVADDLASDPLAREEWERKSSLKIIRG